MNKITHHTQPIPVVRPATDAAIIAADKPPIPNAGTAPYLRRVVCAAIRLHEHGRILVVGPRHYDATMQKAISATGINVELKTEEQGFIDQHGVFMTRQEALTVARAAGQIRYRCGGDEHALYSENLY